MVLTLDNLFNEPKILKAVIDRMVAIEQDVPVWRRYIQFEQTTDRVFKTFLGTQTGVRMGSVISQHGAKPIRERHALGKGYGEVAFLGDRYQMDNDRLDLLKSLIDRFNRTNGANLNEIINFLVDDFRQVRLAPHKRMDKVLGDLLGTAEAHVKVANNPQGIDGIDIVLPFKKAAATVSEKGKMLPFLQDLMAKNRKLGKFATMLMTRKTFMDKFALTEEFTAQFKQSFGQSEIITKGGILTDNMSNALFAAFGIPAVRIMDDYVETPDGETVQMFPDEKITFIQTDNLGKMRWHETYEASDPVPGKVYNNLEAGQWISTQRTDEGRFIEYGCEWIPELKAPNKILLLDVSKVK